MSSSSSRLTVFAPAKINLYLHVTNRRADGYHTLDSFVCFADIGDRITLESASSLSFDILGSFARRLSGREASATPDSSNLVMKAVWGLARLSGQSPGFKITLEKNLPLGAGLGGGSADAAAVLRALCRIWDLPADLEGLDALMLSLGADVPVCFSCRPAQVRGIGEDLKPAPAIPETPIVLIHPGTPCETKDIFSRFNGRFGEPVALPHDFPNPQTLCDFLRRTDNMLSAAAMQAVPDIRNVLNALEAQDDCLLARMSGSGSACFGLFADEHSAAGAAAQIQEQNPDWWIRAGWLGRTESY